jgi:hypothetical protein
MNYIIVLSIISIFFLLIFLFYKKSTTNNKSENVDILELDSPSVGNLSFTRIGNNINKFHKVGNKIILTENGVEKWSSIDSSLSPDDNSSLLFNDDGDITINNSNSTWSLSREKCLQNTDCKNSYFNKNNGPYKLKFEINELNLYDNNNNKIISLPRVDCELSRLNIDNCVNGIKEYSSEIIHSGNNGKSCLEISNEKFGNYSWQIIDNKVKRTENCIDCELSPLSNSNCINDKITFTSTVTRPSNSNGKSCIVVAKENFGNYDWKLSSDGLQVKRTDNCVDCILGNESSGDCINYNKQYYSYITSHPNQYGIDCVSKAKNMYGDYQWQLSYDGQNKPQRVIRYDNCIPPVDCVLSNLMQTNCINDKKDFYTNIITRPSSTGVQCIDKAKELFGNEYQWQLSNDSSKIYRTENCITPINCELSSLSKSNCVSDQITFTSNVVRTPNNNGKSCVEVAKENFGNYEWQLSSDGSEIKRVDNCRDCILDDQAETNCVDRKQQVYANILQQPNNDGKNCIDKAIELYGIFGIYNQDYAWKLSEDNKKVYRNKDCIVPVDCKLFDTLVETTCDGQFVNKYYDIESRSVGTGKTCQEIASEKIMSQKGLNYPSSSWIIENNKVIIKSSCNVSEQNLRFGTYSEIKDTYRLSENINKIPPYYDIIYYKNSSNNIIGIEIPKNLKVNNNMYITNFQGGNFYYNNTNNKLYITKSQNGILIEITKFDGFFDIIKISYSGSLAGQETVFNYFIVSKT